MKENGVRDCVTVDREQWKKIKAGRDDERKLINTLSRNFKNCRQIRKLTFLVQ